MAAELLLRTGQFEQARALYESVASASGEAWARAGVARALLSMGNFTQATDLLKALTQVCGALLPALAIAVVGLTLRWLVASLVPQRG